MVILVVFFVSCYSYKVGIMLGLIFYVIGVFLFWFVVKYEVFNFFLILFYILIFGLVFLEIIVNFYIFVMGDL